MKEIDKYDKLSKRLDKLDKDYSSTLSELLTDLHYIKCKVNKSDQLDYIQKENDIECKKVSELAEISDKKFAFRFGFCVFIVIGALAILSCLIKYLFF